MGQEPNAIQQQFKHTHDNNTNTSKGLLFHYPSLNGESEPDPVEIFITLMRREQKDEDAQFIKDTLTEIGLYESGEFSYLRDQIEDILQPNNRYNLLDRLFG